MQPGPTDEELLHLLQQVEDIQLPPQPQPDPIPEQQGDPCHHCGNPADNTGDCHNCDTPGCLPPDLWTPGMPDCCLTLCARCARSIHWTCSTEDAAGNPTCPTCKY